MLNKENCEFGPVENKTGILRSKLYFYPTPTANKNKKPNVRDKRSRFPDMENFKNTFEK